MKTQLGTCKGPGAWPTTVALLVIAPLLYCAAEWLGPAVSPSEPRLVRSRVAGRVMDLDKNAPVAGARVIVWASDNNVLYPSYHYVAVVESKIDGRFTIDYNHREGDVYRLSAQADEYDSSNVTLIAGGDQNNVMVTVRADLQRRLVRARAPRATLGKRPWAGPRGIRAGTPR